MDITTRLYDLESEIKNACHKANRSCGDLTLIAVSKGQPFDALLKAYDLGLRNFGESYAQEMALKMALAKSHGLNDIKWHFIGGIQSNKIKTIKDADFIHSIASLKHAESLDKVGVKKTPIFIQINLDKSLKRQGFFKEEVEVAIHKITELPHLDLRGLMAVLPLDKALASTFWFAMLVKLKDEILAKGLLKKVELSMGMSDDFLEAIAKGANYLRIGTALFGQRNYE